MNNKIKLPLIVSVIWMPLSFVGAAYVPANATADSTVSTSQKQGAQAILERSASKIVVMAPKSVRYTRAAAALRSIAEMIKMCPRVIQFDGSKDRQEGDGPLDRSRLYYGPPVNVTWGVGRRISIQSPRQGYVQFFVPREFWVPPDVQNKWAHEATDLYAQILRPMPPLEYRYNFTLGPDGIQPSGILVRSAGESEWKSAPAGEKTCSSSGCTPACWQSAAQPNQTLSGAGER